MKSVDKVRTRLYFSAKGMLSPRPTRRTRSGSGSALRIYAKNKAPTGEGEALLINK